MRLGLNTRLPVLAASVALGIALAGCATSVSRVQAPAFELTDQRGAPVRLDSLRGRTVLLTFLYSHCPDTCPLYLFNLRQALSGLGASGEGLSVVVVTVDPERDTVAHLARFARSWPENWHFLTGGPVDVARVWGEYGIYVEKDEAPGHHSAGPGYRVIHTARLLVINREGYVTSELRGEWSAEDAQAAAALALAGDEAGRARSVFNPLAALLQRCGEFASSYPLAFLTLVLLLMLPGLILPALMLRSLWRTR